MEKLKIIKRIDEATDWVNSLVVVQNSKGKLRICIDPRNLNKALMREHHPFPSIKDLTSKLAGAKYFSVLDASNGFWQVELDEESSKLCTFNSPFGRYRYLRMPFGISCAPEIFHKAIEHIFEDLDVTFNFQDDIIVWGKDSDEHNERLRKTMDRVRESKLKLNKDKC